MAFRIRKNKEKPQDTVKVEENEPSPSPSLPIIPESLQVDIAPSDPLLVYLLNTSGVVEIDKLNLDSQALSNLKELGVKLSVPLVSQGELIGLINLGPRRSEQDYSTDDRRLLHTLATQAAPALRVAQLARQQQAEARERERIEQELRVARVIQQTLLPREIPQPNGWQLAAYWQPARAVSGDFYDFIHFEDGRLGIVAGDVTDKGVPAALVMATTRSILRSASERSESPGAILAQVNDLLCPDIPANMFITCLYMVLDPQTGRIQIANAGHNLPCQHTEQGVIELEATGMPLGLMQGMIYDEIEMTLASGDSLLVYSDGLVEAHNSQGEMFGFPRLRSLVAQEMRGGDQGSGKHMILDLQNSLSEFTGPGWEQEDDVTFVTVERLASQKPQSEADILGTRGDEWQTLGNFNVPSIPGNEILAMEKVAVVLQSLSLEGTRLDRLKTAVAEATMNAMEHGNHYQADIPVEIKVLLSPETLVVLISDHGGGHHIPNPEEPDLEAKLAGLQSPRGWGLFLIQNMVDEVRINSDETHHTMELVMNLKGDEE